MIVRNSLHNEATPPLQGVEFLPEQKSRIMGTLPAGQRLTCQVEEYHGWPRLRTSPHQLIDQDNNKFLQNVKQMIPADIYVVSSPWSASSRKMWQKLPRFILFPSAWNTQICRRRRNNQNFNTAHFAIWRSALRLTEREYCSPGNSANPSWINQHSSINPCVACDCQPALQ